MRPMTNNRRLPPRPTTANARRLVLRRSPLPGDERGMETIQAVLLLAIAALILIGLHALWDDGSGNGIRGRTVAILGQLLGAGSGGGGTAGSASGAGTETGAFDDPAAENPTAEGTATQTGQSSAGAGGTGADNPVPGTAAAAGTAAAPGGGTTGVGNGGTDSGDENETGTLPTAGSGAGRDTADQNEGEQSGESPWVKEIDIREQIEPESRFLVFSARPGVPGHAFVVWGAEDDQKQMSTAEAFGLYPDPSLWNQFQAFTFRRVPGRTFDEAVRGKPGAETVRLIVRVDSRQYELVKRIRAEWDAKGEYKLLQRDCISFTAQIATALGLRTPNRGTSLPEEFMQQVVELNTP